MVEEEEKLPDIYRNDNDKVKHIDDPESEFVIQAGEDELSHNVNDLLFDKKEMRRMSNRSPIEDEDFREQTPSVLKHKRSYSKGAKNANARRAGSHTGTISEKKKLKGIKSEGKIQTSKRILDEPEDQRFQRRLDLGLVIQPQRSVDLGYPNKRISREKGQMIEMNGTAIIAEEGIKKIK